MNMGLITSFVIGGMMLLAMVALSSRITENAGNTSLDLMAKSNVSTITEIIQNDFRRIGFGVPGTAITAMSGNDITFQTTFNTDSTLTIRWHYDLTDSVTATDNPDDRPLYRIIDGEVSDISLVITDFNLTYLDADGDETAVPADVRSIRVRVTCASPVGYDGYFGLGYWEGVITPRSLQ
jgi:hypothetical protein